MISPLQSRWIELPDALVTPEAAPFQNVANYTGEPIPADLLLSVERLNNVASTVIFPPPILEGQCGQSVNAGATRWESYLSAGYRVTYGAGGAYRTIFTDLRSQRLYLGCCSEVRVDAFRWRVTEWPMPAPTVRASASIVPSAGGPCDEATVTITSVFPPLAAINKSLIIPAHARYWTPIVTSADASELWGTTVPDLVFGRSSQTVTVRPASHTIVPYAPRYEVAPAGYSVQGAQSLLIYSKSGAVVSPELVVGARFYIAT